MFRKKIGRIGWSLTALVLTQLTSFHVLAATDKTAAGFWRTQEKKGAQTAKQRQEIVRRIIAETLAVNVKKVVSGAHFVKDLAMHSLGSTELRLRLEEKFNLEISNDDAAKMPYVSDVFAFVEKHHSTK